MCSLVIPRDLSVFVHRRPICQTFPVIRNQSIPIVNLQN